MFQLSSLLAENKVNLTIQISENKIKFSLGKIKLVSKVIDGKFPDYKKVVPTNNGKILSVANKRIYELIERLQVFLLIERKGVRLV